MSADDGWDVFAAARAAHQEVALDHVTLAPRLLVMQAKALRPGESSFFAMLEPAQPAPRVARYVRVPLLWHPRAQRAGPPSAPARRRPLRATIALNWPSRWRCTASAERRPLELQKCKPTAGPRRLPCCSVPAHRQTPCASASPRQSPSRAACDSCRVRNRVATPCRRVRSHRTAA